MPGVRAHHLFSGELKGSWKCVWDCKESELSLARSALQSPVLAAVIHIAGLGTPAVGLHLPWGSPGFSWLIPSVAAGQLGRTGEPGQAHQLLAKTVRLPGAGAPPVSTANLTTQVPLGTSSGETRPKWGLHSLLSRNERFCCLVAHRQRGRPICGFSPAQAYGTTLGTGRQRGLEHSHWVHGALGGKGSGL